MLLLLEKITEPLQMMRRKDRDKMWLDKEENHGVNVKYNVFDKFKSMNIDEMAEWLDKYGTSDNSPWMSWFDQKYCKRCEDIMCKYEDGKREFLCSYCELNGNCKFFPNLDEVPDNKMSIKMWLESNSWIE